MTYTVESKVFCDKTRWPIFVYRSLHTLPSKLAILDFLVFSVYAKILSHSSVFPPRVPLAAAPLSPFFTGWLTPSHVSLIFQNSSVHSSKGQGEPGCFCLRILRNEFMFLNEHELGGWNPRLPRSAPLICWCEYLTTEGVIPVFKDKCFSYDRANKHKPTLHLVLKEEVTICSKAGGKSGCVGFTRHWIFRYYICRYSTFFDDIRVYFKHLGPKPRIRPDSLFKP